MKKTITYEEYLKLYGLFELAKSAYKRVQECEDAIVELLEMPDDSFGAGCFSDAIFGFEENPQDALKKEEIKIAPKRKKKSKF